MVNILAFYMFREIFLVVKGQKAFYNGHFDQQFHQLGAWRAPIRWPEATSPPEELEGGGVRPRTSSISILGDIR